MGKHKLGEVKILFDDWNNQVFFSRIPRTASRHLYYVMNCNNVQVKAASPAQYADLFGPRKLSLLNGKEYFHKDLETSRKLFEFPRNRFSVVRNPVERFKSAFLTKGYFNLVNSEDLDSYEKFYQIMESRPITIDYEDTNTVFKDKDNKYYSNKKILTKKFKGLKNSWNNWFRSQRIFIDDSFRLWKFENKFEKQFYDWFNQTFDYSLDINKPVDQYRKKTYDIKVDYSLSKLACKNIEKYYCEDMELWETID